MCVICGCFSSSEGCASELNCSASVQCCKRAVRDSKSALAPGVRGVTPNPRPIFLYICILISLYLYIYACIHQIGGVVVEGDRAQGELAPYV